MALTTYRTLKQITTHHDEVVLKVSELLRDLVDVTEWGVELNSFARVLNKLTITTSDEIPEGPSFDPDYYEIEKLL